MTKYHITKNGQLAECKATTKTCPLGEDTPHIEADNLDEALVAQRKATDAMTDLGPVLLQHMDSDWLLANYGNLSAVEKERARGLLYDDEIAGLVDYLFSNSDGLPIGSRERAVYVEAVDTDAWNGCALEVNMIFENNEGEKFWGASIELEDYNDVYPNLLAGLSGPDWPDVVDYVNYVIRRSRFND